MFTEDIKTDAKAKTIRIQITRKQQTASVLVPFSNADTANVKKMLSKTPDTLGSDFEMQPYACVPSTATDTETPRHTFQHLG